MKLQSPCVYPHASRELVLPFDTYTTATASHLVVCPTRPAPRCTKALHATQTQPHQSISREPMGGSEIRGAYDDFVDLAGRAGLRLRADRGLSAVAVPLARVVWLYLMKDSAQTWTVSSSGNLPLLINVNKRYLSPCVVSGDSFAHGGLISRAVRPGHLLA